jgi:predicted transcriptional regulator YheO
MSRQPRKPSHAERAATSPPGPAQDRGKAPFTAEDRALLASYEPLVDAVAELIGPHCEVVLHSLEDPQRAVVRIANGHVTGRTAGSPLTDLALTMLQKYRSGGELHSTYFSSTRNGRQLKSSTAIIRNRSGRAVGMLCVNLDLDVPLHRFAAAYAPAPAPGSAPGPEHLAEHYASNVSGLLESTVDAVVQEVGEASATTASRRNKEIVTALFDRGVFEIKDAIHYVANRLKITKHTVYMHIRHRRRENPAA